MLGYLAVQLESSKQPQVEEQQQKAKPVLGVAHLLRVIQHVGTAHVQVADGIKDWNTCGTHVTYDIMSLYLDIIRIFTKVHTIYLYV